MTNSLEGGGNFAIRSNGMVTNLFYNVFEEFPLQRLHAYFRLQSTVTVETFHVVTCIVPSI